MRSKNTKPWRKIVAVISFICIAYMWTEKDIFATYATMPKERVVPLIAQFASTDCPFRMSGVGSSVEAVWGLG